MLCGTVFAQETTPEVTLDFTVNDWNFSETKATDANSYTNSDGYTIVLQGTSGGGYRWYSSDKYLINGKKNATLTLPAFSFDVEKIVVTGRTGASTAVKQNVFVGDVAVSTETTGATGINTYEIAEDYQAAGNVYVLKVTSNHNTQYTKIEIYKKASSGGGDDNTVANYTIDFNTSIATSAKDFAVASNWGHVSGYDAAYDSNMSYTWSETAGVDKSGALLAYRQFKYDWGQSSSGVDVYDLLITPEVKGAVSVAVKQYSGSNSYVEFYKMTDNGDGTFTRGDKIEYTLGEEETLSQSAYCTATINVEDFTRIGIRASYMYLDNFVAEQANIVPEKAITIASADPTATTGTIYWDQQANGKVLVKYTVTVTNTGDVDLTQGTEGYSVSIFNRDNDEVYVTTAVPQDLAVGETSDPFDVQAEVETSVWPNSYSYHSMDLKENLKGSILQRAQSHYNAYQSKFVFRAAQSTSTSSITAAEAWGTITESTTKRSE